MRTHFNTPLFILVLGVLALSSLGWRTATSTVLFTEDWSGDVLSRWVGSGDAGPGFNPRCFTTPGKLIMDCQSGSLKSIQTADYHSPITLECSSVYTEPGANSTTLENTAACTIFGTDDDQGARYSGVYISYKDGWDKMYIIGGGYATYVGSVAHGTHAVKVEWNYRYSSWGYDHWVDGLLINRSTLG